MRAVWWTEIGPPDVLVPGEAPDPAPGPGQALVAVEVASIVFIETQIRAGRSPRPGLAPPAILGNGVGGTVLRAGDPALIGQRVVTTTGGSGGYAELALADEGELIPVPNEITLNEAVALLADGRTALGLHRMAAPQAGETVLVEAAGGGVGGLLVQLAAAAGARVIAAASDERKLASARALGAHVTIDYSDPAWGERLEPVDLAYDGVGGEIGRAALAAVAPGGRFVVHGLASGSVTDTSDAGGVKVYGLGELAAIGRSARELSEAALLEAAAGRLRPVIGQTFPLDQAAAAHAAIEARQTLGKTLLIIV
jgi:NADPH2:quinone reductase